MTHRTFVLVVFNLSAICFLVLNGTTAGTADRQLLEAIRGNDTRAVGALLKAGADPNARDDIGATALMYAAAFSSPDCIRVLLDGGADVNASSGGGASAVIWATGDVAKVRLLLDRGAAANARMRDGTTALVTAARRGNLDVMRLLLARGADPKSAANEKAELLRIAYDEHPETRQILADAGIELKDLAQPGVPALANYPVSNTSAIRALLDMGANPNPRGRFSMVGIAAFQGYLATTQLLIERGANLNARGQQDVTPLMMAAAAAHPDAAIVRLLMEKGADLGARDQTGLTALDWALRQGDTQAARLLQEAGTQSMEPKQPAAVAQSRTRRTARVAIVEALARLAPTSPVAYEQGKCISCHNQILPLMAMKLAHARGIAVDAEAMGHPIRAMLDIWNGRRENLMVGRQVGGGANELTYGLLAFAEAGVSPNSTTDAAISNLASSQRTDGSWVFLDTARRRRTTVQFRSLRWPSVALRCMARRVCAKN